MIMVAALKLILAYCATSHGNIPGWEQFELTDFCNGTCPSSPDSSGLPRYGQQLFPSMAADVDGDLYVIVAKFGGAYLDDPELVALRPSGQVRWRLSTMLASAPQESYSLEIIENSLYVVSTSCCDPQGSTLGHITKVSPNGTGLWERDIVGRPYVGRDGTIYSLATPDTGTGSVLTAYSLATGNLLWNYTDGKSKFSYMEFGGRNAEHGYVCMPAEVNGAQSNKSVVCLTESGQLAYSQHITSNEFIRFDLFASAGRYYVRLFRDNSYAHSGANQVVEVGSKKWSKQFPDDVNFVGVVTFSSNHFVVLTRPDCADTPSGLGCRADSLVGFDRNSTVFNVTLPGKGDVTVNPAFPPQFGPYSASNGFVFASSVKSLHNDNKTYDMWYSAIDPTGRIAWQHSISNIQDLTRISYAFGSRGEFYVIFDGVVYRVPAQSSAQPITV